MVNNLMSGLLGGAGNQPSTSAASSSTSSGTSTSTSATPAGTSQPGAASSNQSGMPRASIRIERPHGPFSGRMPNLNQPGMPRANIRIENPPGLAGFFPGRMPNLPGMDYRNVHKCEALIEKSGPRVIVWHQEALASDAKLRPEGQICRSVPHTHD